MEYRIELVGALPAPDTVSTLLAKEDAAAFADFDRQAGVWRISTSLGAGELIALFASLGCPVDPERLTRLPSVCCGGCSG